MARSTRAPRDLVHGRDVEASMTALALPTSGARRWRDRALGIEHFAAAGPVVATGAHVHASWQVGLVLDGRVRVTAGGRDHALAAGDGLWVAPEEPHAVLGGGRGCYVQVELPDDLLRMAAAPAGVLSADARAALLALHASEGSARATALRTLVAALARDVVAAPGPRRDPLAEEARAYLERAEARVPLATLAARMGVPVSTLRRRFRARFGVAPAGYQLGLRVQRGLVLVARGAEIGRAAADAGFTDQAHFTRHARRVLGMPPGQWARRP